LAAAEWQLDLCCRHRDTRGGEHDEEHDVIETKPKRCADQARHAGGDHDRDVHARHGRQVGERGTAGFSDRRGVESDSR
jgi:hypothetical protein